MTLFIINSSLFKCISVSSFVRQSDMSGYAFVDADDDVSPN